jgi:hypothetical protein
MTAAAALRRRKSGKNRKSNATLLAHRKFRWIEQLSTDHRLPVLALRACIQLSAHMSLDHNGSAIIGQDKIAKKLNAWRQDVSQALREAAALGHLEIIRRGRDHANGYRMVLQDEASAAPDVTASRTSSPADDVGNSPTSSDHMMSGISDFDVGNFPTDSPLFPPGALTEPPGEGERTGAKERPKIPPAAGTPPLARGPAAEVPRAPSPPIGESVCAARKQEDAREESAGAGASVPESASEHAAEEGPSAATNLDQARAFREFRTLWRRGWASDDTPRAQEIARTAFVAACREAKPEEILEGARAWVAAADAPRFLPPLAKWLAARGWEQPPPTKRRASQHRGGSNGARRQRPNLAEIAFELARQYEEESAS